MINFLFLYFLTLKWTNDLPTRFTLDPGISGSLSDSNYSKIVPHYKNTLPIFKRRLNRKYKSAYERRDIHAIKELAKQNHAPSLHTLGELIEIYDKNISKAFELFQKSADLGFPEAFSSMSFYLRYGFESYKLPQNRLLSAIYTTIGSEGNSVRSMLTLANDYKYAFIRPKSYRSSIELLLKLDSAYCNCIETSDCDQILPTKIKTKTMRTYSINEIFHKKLQILRYRAKLGDRNSMFEVAKIYYNSGDLKNITEAYKIFSKIANYEDSEVNLETNKHKRKISEDNQTDIQQKENYTSIKQKSAHQLSKFIQIFDKIKQRINNNTNHTVNSNRKILDEKDDENSKSNINDPLVSKSLSYIARMYHLGQLFKKNITKAKELYLLTHNEITSLAGLGLIELEDGNEDEAEILLSIASRMGHLGASFNLASLHYSKNKSLGISEFFSLANRPDSDFLLAQLNVASMLSQGISSNTSMLDEYVSMKYLWRIAQKGLWNNASDVAAHFFVEKEKTTTKERRIFLLEKALLIWMQLADMGMKIPAFNAGLLLFNRKAAIRRYNLFQSSEYSESKSDDFEIRKALSNLEGILNDTKSDVNDSIFDHLDENFFGWTERKMLKIAVRMFKICDKPQWVSLSYFKMNETAKCLKYLKKIKPNKLHYVNKIYIKLMLEERINHSFKFLFGNLTELRNRRKRKLNSSYYIFYIQTWGKFFYKLLNFYSIESKEERNDLLLRLKTFRIDIINIILLLLLLRLIRYRVSLFFLE